MYLAMHASSTGRSDFEICQPFGETTAPGFAGGGSEAKSVRAKCREGDLRGCGLYQQHGLSASAQRLARPPRDGIENRARSRRLRKPGWRRPASLLGFFGRDGLDADIEVAYVVARELDRHGEGAKILEVDLTNREGGSNDQRSM